MLTKTDFLIITGDFGLVWDHSKEEVYWRNWLQKRALPPFSWMVITKILIY
jgi:hypothetical protein